jgi:Fic family protein
MNFDKSKPFNDLPPLPPVGIELESAEVLKRVIPARAVLAELKQACLRIPNPTLLISTIGLREAQSSSEIENIVTTGDELYQAYSDQFSEPLLDSNTKEVLRYREALYSGFEALASGRTLSTRMFEEIVKKLRRIDDGVRKAPGTKIVNASTGEIIFTPPEGEEVIRARLAELEQFIHGGSPIDPLIKLALIHYQFEAIHPFADGNGRTGRIINLLYLISEGLLTIPVLFLSRAILENKSEYYRLIGEVSSKQNWLDWIGFMVEAVHSTAKDTLFRVESICSLQTEVENEIQQKAPKIYSAELVSTLFEYPYCKIKFLENKGIAKRETASRYLHTLEELKILTIHHSGRDKYFINHRLMRILIAR